MEILLQFVLLVVGFVMLIKGADWFVEGSAGIADKFGVPQLVIGLTIVAMGTSAPEAAVSISAAFKGNADITIGNVVGSNILNVLIILGVTAVIINVAIQTSTIKIELPYMIFISAVMLVLGFTGVKSADADASFFNKSGYITRIEGVILWILFIAYLTYLFIMAKKNKSEEEDVKKQPMWKLILFGIIGLVLIVLGSDVTVDAASKIAEFFGMSERFIGLTVVALGTSLPELFTSVTAARKGKADIAIGNIVGSNIFNILFVVGTTALITPVKFQYKFIVDTVVSVVAGIVLLLSVLNKDKQLKRPAGIIMLLCYAGYFTYLVVNL